MQRTTADEAVDLSLPDSLESATGKLLYTYLSTSGPQTPDQLASALDLHRLTLFPVLETLREQGCVRKRGEYYTLTT
jgi:DNA-binding IclR family transcriptional regulator